ncbi:hypothetical protein QVD17_04074 [Tagetes erecta]|uniref:G protein gamma domain-containing protein n=1 Tax=Tagetes erecta TaxID=13708 RepID=A0AAD8LC40_TARER|nr:hypothetical protein QVD17_04074 [Tagetes erecta]
MCTCILIHLFLYTFPIPPLLFKTPNSSNSSPPIFNRLTMDSPSQPNGSSPPSQPTVNVHNRPTYSALGSSNFIGKHRLAAIISQQNQQIQVIQEELDQLETLGESSLVCEQLISSVESSTDALLPVTRGPADGGWDRWFQRANQSSSRNRKRWI